MLGKDSPHSILEKAKFAITDVLDNTLRSLKRKDIDDKQHVDTWNDLLADNSHKLSSFVHYDEIHEEGLWIDDNPYGPYNFIYGLELTPALQAGNDIEEAFVSLYDMLDEDSVAYSIADVGDEIYGFLESWMQSQRKARSSLYEQAVFKRSKFMLDWAEGNMSGLSGLDFKPRSHRLYVFIKSAPVINESLNEEDYAGVLSDALAQRDNVMAALSSFMPRKLSGVDSAKAIHFMANRSASFKNKDNLEYKTGSNLAGGLFGDDLVTKIKYNKHHGTFIEQEDRKTNKKSYTKCLTVTGYYNDAEHPFRANNNINLLGGLEKLHSYIPGRLTFYTIVHKPKQSKVLNTITKKDLYLMHSAASGESGFSRRLKTEADKEIDQNQNELKVKGQSNQFMRVITGVVITEDSVKQLYKAKNKLLEAYKRERFRVFDEHEIIMPMFLTALPGLFREPLDGVDTGLCRCTTMTSLNAATLSHCAGVWSGNHPGIGGGLTLSRLGTFININPFQDYSGNNFNFFCAADSGSGKSYFINEIVRSIISSGGYVRIIDAGHSYSNNCQIQGGQIIEFSDDSNIVINPFSEIYEEKQLSEAMEVLTRFVMQMAFPKDFETDQGISSLPDADSLSSLIESAIQEIWHAKQSKMDIEDIYNYFLDKKEQEQKLENKNIQELEWFTKIATSLKPYAIGIESKWFKGKSTLHFDNPFIILELDGLDQKPRLKALIIKLLMIKLTDEMYLKGAKDPDTGRTLQKAIIVDEAWDLLNMPEVADFLEKASRRVRKYLGCLGIISQSFMDADKSVAGKVIIQNSNIKFALKQGKNAIQNAVDAKLLNFTERQMDMIASVNKGKDFSEIFVYNDAAKVEAICRFATDKYSYFMFTSSAKDKDDINKLVETGKTKHEAIDELSSKIETAMMFSTQDNERVRSFALPKSQRGLR